MKTPLTVTPATLMPSPPLAATDSNLADTAPQRLTRHQREARLRGAQRQTCLSPRETRCQREQRWRETP